MLEENILKEATRLNKKQWQATEHLPENSAQLTENSPISDP